MGDDLTEAGEFITSAMAQMDVLLSGIRLDRAQAEPKLAALAQSAKSAHARGIFRAAQRVSQSYQNGHSQPKIDGRLMSLYKLVVQYHAGWLEIAPQEDGQNSQTDTAPIVLRVAAQDQLYADAKTTLSALLPFAGPERARLEQLISLDFTPQTGMAPAPQKSAEAKPSQDKPAKPAPLRAFENLMPDLINEALRYARGQGKSVSLSYAAEGLQLSPLNLATVNNRLEEAICDFIARKIATPSQRVQQGRPRSGHIDISVKTTPAASGEDSTIIIVSCEDEQKEIGLQKSPAARQKTIAPFDPYMELGT